MNYLTDANGKLLINNGKALKAPKVCQKIVDVRFTDCVVDKGACLDSGTEWFGPIGSGNKTFLSMAFVMRILNCVDYTVEFAMISVKHGTINNDPLQYFVEHENSKRVIRTYSVDTPIYCSFRIQPIYSSLSSQGRFNDALTCLTVKNTNGEVMERAVKAYRSQCLPETTQVTTSTQTALLSVESNQKINGTIFSETAINFDDLLRDYH